MVSSICGQQVLRTYRKRPLRAPLRLCLLLCGFIVVASIGAGVRAESLKTYGNTGGILKFPNSLQPNDKGNAFGVTWLKHAVTLKTTDKTTLAVFFLGNYVRDSHPYAWNNALTGGLGVELVYKVVDGLKVTFSVRHDWMTQLNSVKKEATRGFINYSYFKNWHLNPPGDGMKFRLGNYALHLDGAVSFPSSLDPNDNNVLFTPTGEFSAEFMARKTKFVVIPFVGFDAAWDRDQNNYNNKFIPTIGAKIRYPLDKGNIILGVNYGADFRWVLHTYNAGPSVFLRWNKSW